MVSLRQSEEGRRRSEELMRRREVEAMAMRARAEAAAAAAAAEEERARAEREAAEAAADAAARAEREAAEAVEARTKREAVDTAAARAEREAAERARVEAEERARAEAATAAERARLETEAAAAADVSRLAEEAAVEAARAARGAAEGEARETAERAAAEAEGAARRAALVAAERERERESAAAAAAIAAAAATAAAAAAAAAAMAAASPPGAQWQRAGFLFKLPMSNPLSEKWKKRLCVAKDGFLFYYDTGSPAQAFFDTKPKGAIPLGGCRVERVARGPPGAPFGLRVSQPDFRPGKTLLLAAELEEEQAAWERVIRELCSRVTVENALLGQGLREGADGGAPEGGGERLRALREDAQRVMAEANGRLGAAAAAAAAGGGGAAGATAEAPLSARWQRSGTLWKLPMSRCAPRPSLHCARPKAPSLTPPFPPCSHRPTSESWQQRFFVAKDGWLLFYAKGSPETFFDTRPKGVVPLGGARVERAYRGPPGSKWGLRITHPSLTPGKMLLLGSSSEEEQLAWEKTIRDGAAVTVENALTGDGFLRGGK
jgi:hypothetical protein